MFTPSTQVPPFLQLFPGQSSRFSSQFWPAKPAGREEAKGPGETEGKPRARNPDQDPVFLAGDPRQGSTRLVLQKPLPVRADGLELNGELDSMKRLRCPFYLTGVFLATVWKRSATICLLFSSFPSLAYSSDIIYRESSFNSQMGTDNSVLKQNRETVTGLLILP